MVSFFMRRRSPRALLLPLLWTASRSLVREEASRPPCRAVSFQFHPNGTEEEEEEGKKKKREQETTAASMTPSCGRCGGRNLKQLMRPRKEKSGRRRMNLFLPHFSVVRLRCAALPSARTPHHTAGWLAGLERTVTNFSRNTLWLLRLQASGDP